MRLTPGAVEALERHKIDQDRKKTSMGSLWQEQGLVFPSSIGTPFNPQQSPQPLFQAPAESCGGTPDKVPRPEAHLRYVDVLQRRAPENRSGDFGPRADYAHLGHL